MSPDYWSIIRRSFKITWHNPLLWIPGLFLAGGFNANFFYLLNLRLHWRDGSNNINDWIGHHIRTSHHVVFAAAVVFIVIVAVMLMVNWAKTIFILQTSNILQIKRLGKPEHSDNNISLVIKESRRYLRPVIAMSLFTLLSMILLTGILGGTPKLLFESRGAVWLVAALVFFVLVWFFSCLNIFATFFIILYQRSFGSALNLALELIISRWQNILEMSFLLMLIYILFFFGGGSLVFILKMMSEGVLLPIAHFGLGAESAILGLTTLLSALLLWLWLAAVNTFFNACLLLLFAHLVQPPYHPEFGDLAQEVPSVRPEPATFRVDKGFKI